MKKNSKKKDVPVIDDFAKGTAVKFEHVFFYYDESEKANGNYTVSDISFTINPGSYVTIIGHNGSGKSTLAKLLCGILEPCATSVKESGIYIFGEKMTYENYSRIQHQIGMVFQNPDNQFIGATVKDDIAFGLENDCVPASEMEKLIEEYSTKVGMHEFLDREPSALSGGQKQRVAIAGTLVRHPKILVLDEATSMLDPKGKREITRLIKMMREENPELTIISITHDIEEAYQSDEVIVLNHGKIVKIGSPKEVFADFETLKNIKLDIPFFQRLQDELQKYGIDITGVDDISSLVRLLCR
ncbi:MAG TPA: energy-coupling factor transporter ATPase [Firmicutes bacterium]|nr:energy-coupling factor transporter ATPase [Bacillota bacterium]